MFNKYKTLTLASLVVFPTVAIAVSKVASTVNTATNNKNEKLNAIPDKPFQKSSLLPETATVDFLATSADKTHNYAALLGNGVWSYKSGSTAYVKSDLPTGDGYTVTALAIDSLGHIWVGTTGNGVYISTNEGTNFTKVNVNAALADKFVTAIAFNNGNAYLGFQSGIGASAVGIGVYTMKIDALDQGGTIISSLPADIDATSISTDEFAASRGYYPVCITSTTRGVWGGDLNNFTQVIVQPPLGNEYESSYIFSGISQDGMNTPYLVVLISTLSEGVEYGKVNGITAKFPTSITKVSGLENVNATSWYLYDQDSSTAGNLSDLMFADSYNGGMYKSITEDASAFTPVNGTAGKSITSIQYDINIGIMYGTREDGLWTQADFGYAFQFADGATTVTEQEEGHTVYVTNKFVTLEIFSTEIESIELNGQDIPVPASGLLTQVLDEYKTWDVSIKYRTGNIVNLYFIIKNSIPFADLLKPSTGYTANTYLGALYGDSRHKVNVTSILANGSANPLSLTVDLIDPTIARDKSTYQLVGKYFNPIGDKKEFSQDQTVISNKGIYFVHIEDMVGNTYDTYIQIGGVKNVIPLAPATNDLIADSAFEKTSAIVGATLLGISAIAGGTTLFIKNRRNK